MNLKITKKRNSQGFTLIEMMVAVSIFVIVAFIVVSTLLTMSYSYKKAQKMRLLMDNFNFALQAMSLNIREGIDYSVPTSCGNNTNSTCLALKPIDSWLSGGGPVVCYAFIPKSGESKGYIKKCNDSSCACNGVVSRLTSPDIDVQGLKFKINDGGSLTNRNKVKIIISGEAGTNARELTNFFIQNTISQRNDNNQ